MLTADDRRLLTDAADTLDDADAAIRDATALGCDPKAMAAGIRAIVDRPAPTPAAAAGVDLDAVEEAEHKMTPGPWRWGQPNEMPLGVFSLHGAGSHVLDIDANSAWRTLASDTSGIVTLRNAAPALIAEVRALRAKLAEATSLLRSAGDLFVEIQATDGEDEHKAITDGAKLSAAIAAALEAL